MGGGDTFSGWGDTFSASLRCSIPAIQELIAFRERRIEAKVAHSLQHTGFVGRQADDF